MKKFLTAIVLTALLCTPVLAQNAATDTAANTSATDQAANTSAANTPAASDTNSLVNSRPLPYDLSAKPGETVTQEITLTNTHDKDVRTIGVVVDFDVVNEDGTIRLTDTVNSEYSLTPWVTLKPQDFTLGQGQSKKVAMEIAVPADAKPGVRWGMVFFQAVDVTDPKNPVNMGNARAALFLTIQGEGSNLTDDAKPLGLTVTKRKDADKVYDFEFRVSNKGNTFLRPKATLTLTTLFGKEIRSFPVVEGPVLPNSIARLVTSQQLDKDLRGIYKVKLEGFYGKDNKELKISKTVFLLPFSVRYILYALIAILVIAITIVIDRTMLRRSGRARRKGGGDSGLHTV
jgi:hypothetical protein